MSLTRPIRVATWNIRGAGLCQAVTDSTHMRPILHAMQKFKISALVITETKLSSLRHATPTIRTSYKGITYTAHLGPYVGLITSDSVLVNSFRFGESKRTLCASVALHHGAPDITLLGVYVPPASSTSAVDATATLAELEQFRRCQSRLLVAGDFNARVGFDRSRALLPAIGPHRGGSMNENSESLAQFLLANDLCLPVTLGQRRWSQVWTWMNPNPRARNRRQQLDHVCCTPSLLSSILSIRAYSSNLVSTDHRLVVATMRLPQGTSNRVRPPQAVVTKAIITKPIFTLRLSESLNSSPLPTNSSYPAAKEAILTAARVAAAGITSDRSDRRTEVGLINERLRKLLATHSARPRGREVQEQINRLRNLLGHARRKDKRRKFRRLVHDINQAHARGDARTIYETFRAINRPVAPVRFTPIRFGNQAATTPQEACEEFADVLTERFQDTGQSPPFQLPTRVTRAATELARSSGISAATPTDAEITDAVMSLRRGKAAGPDALHVEYLQVPQVLSWICAWVRGVWEAGHVPTAVCSAEVIMLYKRGGRDRGQSSSYRPIALTNTPAKILEKVLLQRLLPMLAAVSPFQCGFRANRQTSENVALIRLLQEEGKRLRLPVYVVYLDIKSAYDCVDRHQLFHILHRKGCPLAVLSLICQLVNNYTFHVRVAGAHSTQRPTTRGLPQGSCLSPALFSLFLDYTMDLYTNAITTLNEGSIPVPFDTTPLHYLAFADDLVLVARSPQALAARLNVLATVFRNLQVSVATEKCTYHCLFDNSSPSRDAIITDFGQIAYCNNPRYLGTTLPESAAMGVNIDQRLAAASRAKWSIQAFLRNPQHKVRLRYMLLKAKVLASALFSIECSQLPSQELRKINKFQAKAIKSLLNLDRYDDTPLPDLLTAVGERYSTAQMSILRRLNFVYHVLRHQSPLGQALRGALELPSSSFSKKTWIYEVTTEVRRTAELAGTPPLTLANDRSAQRRVTKNYVKHAGTLGHLQCIICKAPYKHQGWLLRHILLEHVDLTA